MKILICSKLFFPDNEIGAVRVNNIAKYLNEAGHQVTVICGSVKTVFPVEPFSGKISIIRISHSDFATKLISKVERSVDVRKPLVNDRLALSKKKVTGLAQAYRKFKGLRLQLYNLYLQIDWFYQAKKAINKKVNVTNYDIVLSSFGPLSSYLTGRCVKKINKSTRWISDLRDNMQNEDYFTIINWIYSYFERDMMLKSDAVTVVSKGQYKMLQKAVGEKKIKNSNTTIVYNGYENEISPDTRKNLRILKVGYTGSLYEGKRDMSLLFKAFQELSDENKISLNQVQIHYAGKSSSDLLKQASYYGVRQIIHDHGYLSRLESIKLQESCDILVVLSWNTKKEQGILSGKFFEYIQAYKPIIAITSGDLPQAEITEMVKELNVGIACEYMLENTDLPLLKNYVWLQYDNIINGSESAFSPNMEKIRSFHYKNIVKKFEEICTNLLKPS